MRYRAVLFNLWGGFTKDVYWDGPNYVSMVDLLEMELACGDEFVDVDEQHLKIGDIYMFMRYSLPCNPDERLAWRIEHCEATSKLFVGSALFFPPYTANDCTGWVEGDCPMSSAEIAASITLVKYSEDFSEAQVLGSPIAVDDQ
jgi:hypothetical protein